MEKVLYRTVFNRKKKLLPNGKALLQVEAYLNGKKKYFSTKIYISPEQWDKRHRTIKDHPNQIRLNKEIRDFVSRLEDAEMQQRQKGKQVSIEYLGEFVKGSLTSVFLDFCRQELKNSDLKQTTQRDHETVFNYLKKFRPGALIEEINYKYLVGFEQFMR
ncbi:phage integrase SAM-like domain-containing protein [uncultured Sunxiuqinia sp.]|uniref:phage integrase SAM-like domain-containing protein n=1 Tax=uncultured Sunxiuqinia sp. TaxID=1573825 RepID=UPI002AA67D44|nr:phage integrase SAM-like domain-containing protein [uncultured Sunxiuqinia sp.]